MAPTKKPTRKSSVKKPVPAKKSVSAAKKMSSTVANSTSKRMVAASKPAAGKKTTSITKTVKKPKKALLKRATAQPAGKSGKTPAKKGSGTSVQRYRCRLCGYIYSPLRGEPHNGIPEGTEFDDLPDTYVCPVCGQQGKGKIGKWGFEPWRPTRYVCSICGYVYDEKRGEPHRGIKPGTPFEDLSDDYTCPVCAIDPKIRVRLGRVFKQGFEPLQI